MTDIRKFSKLLFFFISLSALSSCATVSSEKMEAFVKVHVAESNEPTPVVFFFQHSGGSHNSARQWVQLFEKAGISSVLIDSAGLRGKRDLYSVHYGSDLKPALDVVLSDPRLDLSRYGLMGFSKGGTAALLSASSLAAEDSLPNFVFSLYPGDSGQCPNKHKSTDTDVHVFYGEKDGWGLYQNTIGACKRMASRRENTEFHSMGDVHHGFEGYGSGSFSCCGTSFKIEGNTVARNKLSGIISEVIQEKWGIELEPLN